MLDSRIPKVLSPPSSSLSVTTPVPPSALFSSDAVPSFSTSHRHDLSDYVRVRVWFHLPLNASLPRPSPRLHLLSLGLFLFFFSLPEDSRNSKDNRHHFKFRQGHRTAPTAIPTDAQTRRDGSCAPQETRASAEQPAGSSRCPLSATCLQIQYGLPSRRALSTRGTPRARLRGGHRPLKGGAIRVLRETRLPLIAGNLARLSGPRSCAAAQHGRHARQGSKLNCQKPRRRNRFSALAVSLRQGRQRLRIGLHFALSRNAPREDKKDAMDSLVSALPG